MDFFGVNLATLIETTSYYGLFAIIFAETGLFLGFFLPGDSLIFIAGLLAAQGILSLPILLMTLFFAATIGNTVGYYFGAKVGTKLFTREDSRFFKKKHVTHAHDFYEKHGPKTVVIARFMPIVRTFVPIIAGVANMKFGEFTFYNILGALLWTTGLALGGYWLGNIIPNVDHYILPIVIAIIIASFLPGFIAYYKNKRRGNNSPK